MKSILNELDNKSKRKLKNAWKILCKPNNYLIPETIDELKAYFLKPKIKLGQTECYLNQDAKKELYNTIEIIFLIDEVRNNLSFNTLFQTILEMVQVEIENQLNGSKLGSIESFFEKLSTELLIKCGFRRKLPPIPEITLPLIPSSNSLVDSNTKVAGLRQLFV